MPATAGREQEVAATAPPTGTMPGPAGRADREAEVLLTSEGRTCQGMTPTIMVQACLCIQTFEKKTSSTYEHSTD